ncbi:MAG TPA: hypothetical protein VK730_13595 [Solirubrobacteraceae bacterium]|jgi:hypothetical protein|nr:hypothetical protein [Solirubrobacteraceae bacterium]
MSGITHLRNGLQTVAAAGTPVRLEDEAGNPPGAVVGVILQALETNTGTIVFGGKTVVAKAGTHAAPERKGIALTPGASATLDINDLAAIWIDATVSGDGVSWALLAA